MTRRRDWGIVCILLHGIALGHETVFVVRFEGIVRVMVLNLRGLWEVCYCHTLVGFLSDPVRGLDTVWGCGMRDMLGSRVCGSRLDFGEVCVTKF
jgi:hypothetical protein